MKATNGALRRLSQNCRGHCITFRHRHHVKFAAKLGGGELPELTRKVLTIVDHKVLLMGFQFVSVTFQEDYVADRDGTKMSECQL